MKKWWVRNLEPFLSLILLLFSGEAVFYLLLKKVEKLIIFCFYFFIKVQINNIINTFFFQKGKQSSSHQVENEKVY